MEPNEIANYLGDDDHVENVIQEVVDIPDDKLLTEAGLLGRIFTSVLREVFPNLGIDITDPTIKRALAVHPDIGNIAKFAQQYQASLVGLMQATRSYIKDKAVTEKVHDVLRNAVKVGVPIIKEAAAAAAEKFAQEMRHKGEGDLERKTDKVEGDISKTVEPPKPAQPKPQDLTGRGDELRGTPGLQMASFNRIGYKTILEAEQPVPSSGPVNTPKAIDKPRAGPVLKSKELLAGIPSNQKPLNKPISKPAAMPPRVECVIDLKQLTEMIQAAGASTGTDEGIKPLDIPPSKKKFTTILFKDNGRPKYKVAVKNDGQNIHELENIAKRIINGNPPEGWVSGEDYAIIRLG